MHVWKWMGPKYANNLLIYIATKSGENQGVFAAGSLTGEEDGGGLKAYKVNWSKFGKWLAVMNTLWQGVQYTMFGEATFSRVFRCDDFSVSNYAEGHWREDVVADLLGVWLMRLLCTALANSQPLETVAAAASTSDRAACTTRRQERVDAASSATGPRCVGRVPCQALEWSFVRWRRQSTRPTARLAWVRIDFSSLQRWRVSSNILQDLERIPFRWVTRPHATARMPVRWVSLPACVACNSDEYVWHTFSDESSQAYFTAYKPRHSVITSWDRNGDWKP